MHENKLVHRDLKPDNMLIHVQDGQYNGWVGDLGLCAIYDPNLSTQPASEAWRAPECDVKGLGGKVSGIWLSVECGWMILDEYFCIPAERILLHVRH